MPYTKTPPLISVPDGVNDLEETLNLRKTGPEVSFEFIGGKLSNTKPHSVNLSQISGGLTAQQLSGFRAVILAARDFVHLADGFSKT